MVLFLLPLVFLPIVTDPFGFGKNWILMVSVIVGLVLWLVENLLAPKFVVKTNKIWWWLLVLVMWGWASWWREVPGVRMRSLMDVGGIGTLTAMVGWFFLWMQISEKTERRKQIVWLTASGVLMTVLSIIVFVIPSSKMPIVWPKNNPMLSIDANWSLTGSMVSEGILLIFLLLNWGKKLLEKLKSQENESYLVEAIIVGVLSLALMLGFFRIFKSGWITMDSLTAWIISVEVFKRSPIWGIGIGNYWEAFNQLRPASYNLTPIWSASLKSSSMAILQLWTELGIVGLGIVATIASGLIKHKKNFEWVLVAILSVSVGLLPLSMIPLLLMVWALVSVGGEMKSSELSLKVGDSQWNAAPWVLAVVLVGLSGFGGYWLVRMMLGDVWMRNSLIAASKNDGTNTYNLQIKSIGMNEYSAEYRRLYSQTNLALMSTILNNKDATDDDREKASTLLQQSVREARAAISLDPQNPIYWTSLASIYKQMIGLVDGSADWSFQAYQQAAALDPANSTLKVEMGGLLYAAGNFDEADRVFEQAVVAKQDYPNAWYNWAYSAKKLNKLNEAVSRLTQAVSLVSVSSGDYEKAVKELADWKKELEAATKKTAAQPEQKQPETLKTPQPLPTTGKEEKLDVQKEELEPPAVSPTVTPVNP